jgi:hypothetical protein
VSYIFFIEKISKKNLNKELSYILGRFSENRPFEGRKVLLDIGHIGLNKIERFKLISNT